MTESTWWPGRVITGLLLMGSAAACGGSVAPTPVPAPSAPPPTAPAPAPVAAVLRSALPSKIGSGSWTVTASARIRLNDGAEEQRVETRARVSWALDRRTSGAVRATGQVDAFTVRSTLDTGKVASAPPGPLLLLDGIADSAILRVATRPPQANECDRAESSAAALARELLVRVPDGMAVGDSWRDSTVSLVCRSGVPITVRTVLRAQLESLSEARLVVRRAFTSSLDGKGGSPFRSLELTGTGSGQQRVEIDARTGILERLTGTSTLLLQVGERSPSAPVRTQRVVQQVELKAERVR